MKCFYSCKYFFPAVSLDRVSIYVFDHVYCDRTKLNTMPKRIVTGKQLDTFKEQTKLASLYRGVILHYFADIEHHIESIIMRYFCADDKRAKEFRSRILCDKIFIFELKEQTLKFIVEQNCEEGNKFDQFNKKFNPVKKKKKDAPPQTIWKDIDEVKEWRNILAHRKVFKREERADVFNKDDIYFENFSDNKKVMEPKSDLMNRKIFGEQVDKLERVRKALIELYHIVTGEETE